MSVITVHAEKGGTGKTTISANLAAYLNAAGKRVLLIDADPQANLTFYVTSAPGAGSLYNIFQGVAPEKVIQQTRLFGHILPGNSAMSALGTMQLAQLISPFKALCDSLARAYDYIIIDAPPQLGTLTALAYSVSQRIIIPITPTLYSLQSLHAQVDFLKAAQVDNRALKIAGIAINQYDSRRNLHRQALERISAFCSTLQAPLYKTMLRSYSAYEHAALMHIPVFMESGNAAKDIAALCADIAECL